MTLSGAAVVDLGAAETVAGIDFGSFDSSPPEILVNDMTLAEGDAGTQSVELTVSLARPFAEPVTLQYASIDNSATIADDDYQRIVGSLTFEPGETTKSITVTVNSDEIDEFDERFLINFSGASNAFLSQRQIVISILNDDTSDRGRIKGTARPGSVIYIDANSNSQLDISEYSTVAGNDGSYQLTEIPAGLYFVRQSQISGFFPTSPSGFVGVGEQHVRVPIDTSFIADIVLDSARGQLLVTTGSGDIERVDLQTLGLVDPIETSGLLYRFDTTPDGEFIYVADALPSATSGVVRKIDLDDGSSSLVSYTLESLETGSSYVSIGYNGRGLVTTSFAGSGWNPLRVLDTTTDELLQFEPTRDVGQSTNIYRSADRRRMLLLEANISSGPIHIYDVETESYLASLSTYTFITRFPAAMNRDGSIVATGWNGLTLFDDTLTGLPPVAVEGTTYGLLFDPNQDLLYRASDTEITVYNTNTWSKVLSFPIGSTISSRLQMTISDDSRQLFLGTETDIRVFSLVYDAHSVDVTAGTTVSDVDFASLQTMVSVAVSETEITEGDSDSRSLTYVFSRTGDTDVQTVVDWTAAGDVDAADFGGTLPIGSVTFEPGELEKSITLDVFGDKLVENDETLRLVLNSTTATLNSSILETQVVNDDQATVTIEDVRQFEDAGPAAFMVSLDHPVDVPVTMSYRTRSNSSTSNFVSESGEIVIPAGQLSADLIVAIDGDNIVERDEEYNVILTSLQAEGRAVQFFGGENTLNASGLIINDDGYDLGLTASVDKAMAGANESITYTIRVTNKGDATTDNIVQFVFDNSRYLSFTEAESTPGWNSTTLGTYRRTFELNLGDLAAGEVRDVVFVVTVDDQLPEAPYGSFFAAETEVDISVPENGPAGGDPTPLDNRSRGLFTRLRDPLGGFTASPVDEGAINDNYAVVVAGDFDGRVGAEYEEHLFFWNPSTGQNRIVLEDGSIRTNFVSPTALNGNDFTHVVAGNFDSGRGTDLFFWNPHTGRNRLVKFHGSSNSLGFNFQTNLIGPPAVNGNDFTEFVAGDFSQDGVVDLFFWNPRSGRNRLVQLDVYSGNTTGAARIQTDAIPATAINGNDFQQVHVGQFVANGTEELFFVNPDTGRNRTISFLVDSSGFASLDVITSNRIAPAAINGGNLRDITTGDFNLDGLDDVFAWDSRTGQNRLAMTSSSPDQFDSVINDVVDTEGINGEFDTLLTRRFYNGEYDLTDSIFFWSPSTGRNRLAFG